MRVAEPSIENLILCLQAIAADNPGIKVGLQTVGPNYVAHWGFREIVVATVGADEHGDMKPGTKYIQLR